MQHGEGTHRPGASSVLVPSPKHSDSIVLVSRDHQLLIGFVTARARRVLIRPASTTSINGFMATKRKPLQESKQCTKRQRREDSHRSLKLTHPVLSQYYPRLWTLREYLVAKLPAASRKRRRRLLHLRNEQDDSLLESSSQVSRVCQILDNTIVGSSSELKPLGPASHSDEVETYTQQLAGSAGYDPKTAKFIQSEVSIRIGVIQGSHRLLKSRVLNYSR